MGDHTAPWYYGPEDEKILGDIIKLRAEMKPYFSSQLDALNATGRPFNRPLMWDFPEDPMTWKLAENGIGNAKIPFQPEFLHDGDLVVLAKCNSTAWNQQWCLDSSANTLKLSITAASSKCLDNGGSKTADPPTGPYPVHMWTCGGTSRTSAAQTWSYDAADKSLSDPKKHVCLTTGSSTHPDISPCNPSDKAQQWSFAQDGLIESSSAGCLAVVSQARGSSSSADQYMMGDGYMA